MDGEDQNSSKTVLEIRPWDFKISSMVYTAFAVVFAIIVAVVILFGGFRIITASVENSSLINVSIIALITSFIVGGLLLLILIVAIVFKRLSLSDRNQALGLPEGSIRALIAFF